MPVSIEKATKIVEQALPNGKIETHISYNGLWVFQVFVDNPFEEGLDPFYSVNQETGEFRDFSILTDGDSGEIAALFREAQKK